MFITLFSYLSTAAAKEVRGGEGRWAEPARRTHATTATADRRTFVVVDVEVIGSGEDGDQGGEAGGLALPVHPIPAEETEEGAESSGCPLHHRK